jgi:hypothetical protein
MVGQARKTLQNTKAGNALISTQKLAKEKSKIAAKKSPTRNERLNKSKDS